MIKLPFIVNISDWFYHHWIHIEKATTFDLYIILIHKDLDMLPFMIKIIHQFYHYHIHIRKTIIFYYHKYWVYGEVAFYSKKLATEHISVH